VFGKKFFAQRENQDKLYGVMHFAFRSRDFLVHGKPAGCTAAFSVALKNSGSSGTEIEVEMIDVEVYAGKEFNAHVLGFVPKGVKVSGGLNDRYTFLRQILYVLKE